jgi:Flp pilus assembly protein protease CpaA
LAFLATGATSDYRSRRISNRLNGAAVVVGIALHLTLGGLDGLLFSYSQVSVSDCSFSSCRSWRA